MEEQLNEIEETQHPEGWNRIQKLVEGVWTTTGWAPDEKAFLSHAQAVGGSVRAVTDNGLPLWQHTEFSVDVEAELCDKSCSQHD